MSPTAVPQAGWPHATHDPDDLGFSADRTGLLDAQIGQICATRQVGPPISWPPRSAAVRAFSPIYLVAQRDCGTGRGRAGHPPPPLRRPGTASASSTATLPSMAVCWRSGLRWMIPGWLPSLALMAGVFRHPACRRPGHPRTRPPVPAASGRPGRGSRSPLCAVTGDGLRAARTTDRDASVTAIQEDPVGGMSGKETFPRKRGRRDGRGHSDLGLTSCSRQ
jgi:hypothetical protein